MIIAFQRIRNFEKILRIREAMTILVKCLEKLSENFQKRRNFRSQKVYNRWRNRNFRSRFWDHILKILHGPKISDRVAMLQWF